MFGSGSVYFSGIPAGTFGTSDAENGLSVEGGRIVLGQALGATGDPAAILDTREIPMTFFGIEMRAGTAFTTGGQTVLGIVNNHLNSGLFTCINLQEIDPAITLIGQVTNVGNNNLGAFFQYNSGNDSAQIGVLGNVAPIPAQQRGGACLRAIGVNRNVFVQSSGTGTFSIWGSPGGTETEFNRFLQPVTATLNFNNTLAQTSADLTVNVPGAQLSDAVLLGVPNGSVNANSCFTAWVSAADTVTVRFNNYSAAAIDPASGSFKITVVRILP